jgi:hypothetical protein
MDATGRVRSRPRADNNIAAYNLMLIEQDIEMAGLLVRKQATELYHNNADQWLRMYEEDQQNAGMIRDKGVQAERNLPGLVSGLTFSADYWVDFGLAG